MVREVAGGELSSQGGSGIREYEQAFMLNIGRQLD